MDVPILDQVKIQAHVLVPLVRALQAELGTERANSIVRTALSDVYRAYGEKWWKSLGDASLGEKVVSTFGIYAAEKSLAYSVVEQAPGEVAVDVTECRFAKFYEAIGARELGFLLTCSADHPMAEGFGADVEFTRTQTIMQGASHCDFRYRLRQHKAA